MKFFAVELYSISHSTDSVNYNLLILAFWTNPDYTLLTRKY